MGVDAVTGGGSGGRAKMLRANRRMTGVDAITRHPPTSRRWCWTGVASACWIGVSGA